MLQAIRDRVTGVVAIFVLGLLAVPFVFFGLDSNIQNVPQDAIAEVGDSEIKVSEFQAEFGRYRAQLRQQQGDAYDELQANRPEARREFLENMIDRRLLAQHAESMGMAISANTIAQVIRDVPAFQVDGQFDAEIYRQRMASSRQTASAFERELAQRSVDPGAAGRRIQLGDRDRGRRRSLAARADGSAADFDGNDRKRAFSR